MSTNANAKIIRIKRNVEKKYFFSPDKSRYYLQNSAELTSKSSNRSNTGLIIRFDCNTILIKIDSQNTHVVIMNYHPSSTPLHVHTIAHQNDYTIFVIFDDHILRIRLENSEFVECKMNSFTISSELLQSIIKKSFSTINRGQILRACIFVDKGNFNQFESYNLLLDNEGERIFYKHKGFSFRVPAKITNIEINDTYINLENECNYIFLQWTRKSINWSISIVDRKVDSFYDSTDVIRLYLIKEYEGFCISQTDKIPRFEMLDFQTIATLHVYFSQEITIPEGEIQRLLKLNSYIGWSIESDSEPDSDSESESD